MTRRYANAAKRSFGMISCIVEDDRTLDPQGDDMQKDDEAKAKDVLECDTGAVNLHVSQNENRQFFVNILCL